MCTDVPDTSAASEHAADVQAQIADKQLAMQDKAFNYFKDRQAGVDAVANQVTQAQLDIAKQNADEGADLYNYNKTVFRPVEESLVSQAMRDSTPEYYEQYAQQAMTTAANANANAQAQSDRLLESMGVNPNSGAYATQQQGLQIRNAAGIAAAGNNARDQAQQQSWNERLAAAGLGRNLVTEGNASYGTATNANTAATNATDNANSQAASTLGTPTQYGSMAETAASNASNAYNNIYSTEVGAAASNSGGLMGALGTALGGWASSGFSFGGKPGSSSTF